MPTYKFSKQGPSTLLKSAKWSVLVTPKNGHIHINVRSSFGFRKQALTSVKSELNAFERKVMALYVLNKAKNEGLLGAECINYAEVFGSCFD